MFEVQPGTYNMNPPQGIVNGNILTTRLWGDNLNADQVLGQINAWLGQVQQHLQWQRDSFRSFSVALAEQARDAIVRRRDQLLNKTKPCRQPGYPSKKAARCPCDVRGPRGEAKARAEATSGDGWRV